MLCYRLDFIKKRKKQMIGYVIYSEKDLAKNRVFINMLQDIFYQYKIYLELIIYEQTNIDELLTKPLPDFVINRSRFYDISEKLELHRVRVFNHSEVTKITNDKLETYRYLEGIVPFPETKDGSDYKTGDYAYPIIIKSCTGHGGSEVYKANSIEEETAVLELLKGKKYLVQKCCSDLGKDVRVYIVGNQIVASVLRTSKDSFKSNYSLGGKVKLYSLNDHEKSLVNSILCKLNLDYAGIDFIFHNGKAVFNEIEDAVGARMLYEVSDFDIADMFVKYVVNELPKRCRP